MQPTVGTLVPAVIDALLAAWRTQLPSPWEVIDGPFAPLIVGAQLVTVGAGNEESTDPARVEVDDYGMGGRHHESGVIRCEIAVAWGNLTEGKPSRDLVAAGLALIDAGLREDPSLGGVCDVARLGSQRWMHWQDENGAAVRASCQFEVVYGGWL